MNIKRLIKKFRILLRKSRKKDRPISVENRITVPEPLDINDPETNLLYTKKKEEATARFKKIKNALEYDVRAYITSWGCSDFRVTPDDVDPENLTIKLSGKKVDFGSFQSIMDDEYMSVSVYIKVV